LAKSVGSDVVIDYRHTPNIEEAIRAAIPSQRSLRKAFDTVSTLQTLDSIIQVLSPSGGQVAVVLPLPEEAKAPKNVQVSHTRVGTAYGADQVFARKWYHILGRWLEEGKFKGNRMRIMPNGLASVPEGLELLRGNKVSAEKLVCASCSIS
jgi:threonine dehydrogenase-like Zn-dependent dehydrogenase